MKKIIFLLILLPLIVFSQDEQPQNLFKISLSSLPYKALTVHYERILGNKISVGVGVSYRQKSMLNLPTFAQNAISSYAVGQENISLKNVHLSELQMGNFSVTPEFRYYFGKKDAPEGFYLSVYARANYYDVNLPTTITVTYHGLDLPITYTGDFKVSTYAGGVMFGYQTHISKRFFLDLFLLGGQYGKVNISSSSSENLSMFSVDEKAMIRQKIYVTYGTSEKYFNVNVSDTGVTISQATNFSAIGFRMLGVNLGYSF